MTEAAQFAPSPQLSPLYPSEDCEMPSMQETNLSPEGHSEASCGHFRLPRFVLLKTVRCLLCKKRNFTVSRREKARPHTDTSFRATVRATVRCLLRNHLDAAQLAEQLPAQLHSWEGSCSTVQRSFCSKSAGPSGDFYAGTNQIEVKAEKRFNSAIFFQGKLNLPRKKELIYIFPYLRHG